MPKLLIISSSFQRGGAGKVARSIAEAAAEDGWNVLCAHSSRFASSLPEGVKGYRIGSKSSEYLHAALSFVLDNHGYWSRQATDSLIAGIERFKPDVINLHNVHGYYLNVESLFDYFRKCGVPVVWTLHDSWPVTGSCASPEAADCDRWKSGCGRCPKPGSYPRSLFDRSAENLKKKRTVFKNIPALEIVTMSQRMAGQLTFSCLGDYPVHIIPNGVDTGIFHPADAYTPRSVLAVASQWTGDKGYRDMIRLRKLLPSGFQIKMIGVTPFQSRELARLGITGIERTDSPQKLAEYYSKAEVFVTPTHADNFPTVLLEALACGTPCVCYDTGSISEIITPDCGRVCLRADIKSLSDGIISVCTAGKRAYSPACRRRAESLYSSAITKARYLTLFKHLL